MRIIKKTVRHGGSGLAVVEMISGRGEKSLRWMCGVAGVAFAALVIGMAIFVPQIAEGYQIKVSVLGLMVGGTFVLAAIGRRVFRSVERTSIVPGMRWLGLTWWSPKIPTTKSQIFDIGRNNDAALFVTVRRPEGEVLVSVGPFVDGDQAVKASSLMSPGHQGEVGNDAQVNPGQIFKQLESGVPLAVCRVMMALLLSGLFVAAWFDQTWFDLGLSFAIGIPILVVAVVKIAPSGGVFHNTDDSKSVEFWTRHRFLRRLEYRKSLVSNEAPEFLKSSLHWPSIGWLLLIPSYVGVLVFLMIR